MLHSSKHFAMETHLGMLHQIDLLARKYLFELIQIRFVETIGGNAVIGNPFDNFFVLGFGGLSVFPFANQFPRLVVQLLLQILKFVINREKLSRLRFRQSCLLDDKGFLFFSELFTRQMLWTAVYSRQERHERKQANHQSDNFSHILIPLFINKSFHARIGQIDVQRVIVEHGAVYGRTDQLFRNCFGILFPRHGIARHGFMPRRSHTDNQRRSGRSEEHTSELQSRQYLVCRLLLEKKNIYVGCVDSAYYIIILTIRYSLSAVVTHTFYLVIFLLPYLLILLFLLLVSNHSLRRSAFF